jgi:hypothetical protein
VPLIARMVTEDTKIKEFTIPAGTGVAIFKNIDRCNFSQVAIAASMVHRDTAYWKNPEGFHWEFHDYYINSSKLDQCLIRNAL